MAKLMAFARKWMPYVLLGLLVLLSGRLLRASAPLPLPPRAAVLITARPTGTPPPTTPSPSPTPPPTRHPDATPVLLGETDAGILFQDAIGATQPEPTAVPAASQAPPSGAATLAPTQTPEATPSKAEAAQATDEGPAQVPAAPVLQLSRTDPPMPTATPTYASETENVRVEVTRHAAEKLVYFTAEVHLTQATQLRSAFSSDRFDGQTEPVRDIAERYGAILAVNGDFATMNDGGIIIRNGELFRANRSTRQLLVIDRDGNFIPFIVPPEDAETAASQFLSEGVLHTLVFGPVLVDQGEAVPLPEKFFINTKGAREPRTVICQLGPLHYLFLVVDGRQPGYSDGVSLKDLQALCLKHGAITAFNLDGGGSTTLCYNGNILNEPANGGQRHVPDILYIGP